MDGAESDIRGNPHEELIHPISVWFSVCERHSVLALGCVHHLLQMTVTIGAKDSVCDLFDARHSQRVTCPHM